MPGTLVYGAQQTLVIYGTGYLPKTKVKIKGVKVNSTAIPWSGELVVSVTVPTSSNPNPTNHTVTVSVPKAEKATATIVIG
ncbi:MAG TPA: hypothetical protein VK277_03055 [Acidimicrobiales bacterium]|nr:hypothetical protein [Acidimicrobiales bacterium]